MAKSFSRVRGQNCVYNTGGRPPRKTDRSVAEILI